MHITGIIAEYNPFHNGHLYQLTECKKNKDTDFVIAVMSGNFTQRGNPSISDKFVRTQMALRNGIDMVLELPVPFATASAERFSEAAISILNQTGIVTHLSFGSESGDLETLYSVAKCLLNEPKQLSVFIKEQLRQGVSFPRAREKALIELLGSPLLSKDYLQSILGNPNNILGIEYIKALLKYHSPIVPTTLKREKAHYHDLETDHSIASASAIRYQLAQKGFSNIKHCMPSYTLELLQQHTQKIPSLDDFWDFLQYKFIFSTKEDLYSIWDIPEELCHSLLNEFQKVSSVSELIQKVTSKTYTKATVQRAIFRILLNVSKEDMHELQTINWIPYIRVLGCKKESAILLGELTKKAAVPILTNLSKSYNQLDFLSKTLLDYELNASKLYYYSVQKPDLYSQDFTHSFIKS